MQWCTCIVAGRAAYCEVCAPSLTGDSKAAPAGLVAPFKEYCGQQPQPGRAEAASATAGKENQ